MNISSHHEFLRWQPASCLHVSGGDAATFLQGQFTNELRGLAPGAASYGLWLTVKGKVLGDSFVIRLAGENEYAVVSYHCDAATLRGRLESFIIADDVTVEDRTGDWSAVTIFAGPDGVVPDLRSALGAEILPFTGRRTRAAHAEVLFPASIFDAVRAEFALAREIDATEMERRRIRDGLPAIPADIGPSDLPNEAGLEEVALSFTKGCYLGQEVMARLKSMGQVRRRLLRVHGPAQTPPRLPATVFVGDRAVGELRSAVRDTDGSLLGLAMLTLLHVKPDSVLGFSAGHPANLRLVDPS